MGIVNGPAPEGGATGATDWMTSMTMERDALQVQLQESERLRQEAFRACEIHRQEYEKLRLERDEWKSAVEYQQQQATQLRQQVEALEASVDQEQGRANRLQRWAADLQAQLDAAKNEASKTGWVYVGSHLPDREQLDTEIVRLRNNWSREIDERKALQQQVADLQAQLEAAAVTPQQQPDGNAAERLETLRELIDAVLGWYACTEYLAEVDHAAAWEQVGALIGHLKREAG